MYIICTHNILRMTVDKYFVQNEILLNKIYNTIFELKNLSIITGHILKYTCM